MARINHEFDQQQLERSVERFIAYYHGKTEAELTIAARSLGVPASELTERLAALLSRPQDGPSIWSEYRLSGLSRKASRNGQPLAEMALAGGTSGLELPGEEGNVEQRDRYRMSPKTKATLSRIAKQRWKDRKAQGLFGRDGKLDPRRIGGSGTEVSCQQCGATPSSGYVGTKQRQLWLKRHLQREHGQAVTNQAAPHSRDRTSLYQSAVKLSQQGMSRPDIARKLQVHPSSIQRWLAKGPPKLTANGVFRGREDNRALREKARKMRQQGMSNPAIAEQLHISLSSAQRWASGWEPPPGTSRQQQSKAGKRGGHNAWSGMSAKQRHDEMVRRRAVAKANKAKSLAAAETEGPSIAKTAHQAEQQYN
jgi:transposase